MISLSKTCSDEHMIAVMQDVRRRCGSVRVNITDDTFNILPESGPQGSYKRATFRGSSVYLVGFEQWVKIGFTTNAVQKRIHDIQTGLPFKLNIIATLPGLPATERELHRRFALYRIRGEWFRREGALAKWIDAGCPMEFDDG